ncbi:MAG: phosphoribosylglycinamide formyltransferase [Clostridiales bacterium]|nr:phosphoribosylglycinamide formyltransferase [Clostridiales bacterium]
MKKIAVFASGGGSNFQAVLDACKKGEIHGTITLLIYNRKQAHAKVRANEAGIKSIYINKYQFANQEQQGQKVLNTLLENNIDIIVLAGYLDILHANVIDQYTNKIINTHPALIPSFCGMGFYGEKVHQSVIDYGAKISGCTIHFATKQADEGPVILQGVVDVLKDDTPQTLAARILPLEHKLLVQAVALLCDNRIMVTGRKTIIKDA